MAFSPPWIFGEQQRTRLLLLSLLSLSTALRSRPSLLNGHPSTQRISPQLLASNSIVLIKFAQNVDKLFFPAFPSLDACKSCMQFNCDSPSLGIYHEVFFWWCSIFAWVEGEHRSEEVIIVIAGFLQRGV